MKKSMPIILALIALPAFGQQTIYKCPKPDGGTVIQQMPCSPQGGGEKTEVKPIKGTGDGLRPGELATLNQLSDQNKAADQAHADKQARIVAEERRQEQLNVERRKAAALESQAAAMWSMGRR